MDTPPSEPLPSVAHAARARFRLPRWLRVTACVCLLGLASGTLAYLVTWIDPPRAPSVLAIRINTYPTWSQPRATPNLEPGAPAFLDSAVQVGPTRVAIQRALDDLASRGRKRPVIVYLAAAALQAEAGKVFVLPGDASLDDRATWLPLREVLEKLKACPAQEKLLVLELTPPPPLARSGCVYHDVGAALARELEAVPDSRRLVLSACGPGQKAHFADERGMSAFAHYFHEGLRGHADGCGGLRDGHVTIKELSAFVCARVERWSMHNRGERQTPMLLGGGADFALVTLDSTAPKSNAPSVVKRGDPATEAILWQRRDEVYQSGQFRLTPREFQRRVALNLQTEREPWAPPDAASAWRLPLPREAKSLELGAHGNKAGRAAAQKAFAENWHGLEQQLASARPADIERIKKRFVEETRAKLSSDHLDTVVFAHAVNDPRCEPGMLRLRDQLVHGAEQAQPRSAEALRLRLIADLAMRVEVQAWPRDAIEALLRATQAAENAFRETPALPDFVALLDEPAQTRHAGEVRLWARGYTNSDEAKQHLRGAADQFDRLTRLNQRWRACEEALDEALMELPWCLEALESLPELRTPWLQSTETARALADALKPAVENALPWSTRLQRLTAQLDAAQKHAAALAEHRQTLHGFFAKETFARLERQCRAPTADAAVLQQARAMLSVAAPFVKAEERTSLRQATQALSRRLHEETLALDQQDDEAQRFTPSAKVKPADSENEIRLAALRTQWQFALLELAGVHEERLRALRQRIEQCKADPTNPAGWCELGAEFRLVLTREIPAQYAQETAWRERERLAWIVPPLETLGELDPAALSPTLEHQLLQAEQRKRWLQAHQRYLARDYAGFNLESPGIRAARDFYTRAGDNVKETHVRLGMTAPVGPLTEQQSYAHVSLEVTRQVPPGAFGPLELRFHRTDDAWLEVAPDAVSLPALQDAKEPRTLTHKVPIKVMRKARAERTGLPAPLGLLVEARFEGRSYHHLLNAPVVPSAQELQILVSADPDEPSATLGEIRVRPGKVKQPHYLYVKNLTNRTHKVHVEIKAGEALVYRSQRLLVIEPDAVRKVQFEDGSVVPATELRGPLSMRLVDPTRQKTLDERLVRVDVLSPQEYVKAEDAFFEPGGNGQNKWGVQVQPIRSVAGPAIAAQLILPVQRIPGLLSIGGGTLQVELPTHAKTPHTLFAERLRLAGPADEEGPVYLHIDGVPRAFVYRTTFTRGGEPTQPRLDARPAVRLVAPPCVMAGINCLVDLEVDNAPRDARLEVTLGRILDDGSFKPEVVREFAEAKKRRIDLEAVKDALLFDASITDWTASFDTRAIVGARTLRARLLDAAGKEIASIRQAMVIDDTPPIARFALVPPQVKRGSVLQVQATGVDAETGIAQAMFFLGKPEQGEIPPNAPRFKATAGNREQTQWSAALRIPADHIGPLALSVHIVNHAGLATVDTVLLDVLDRDPGKTGMGQIQGKVVEGLRPQPNLVVILMDAAGKEIARTKTQADGTYTFDRLAPGRYRVLCVKPESQRRATIDVLVMPDNPTRADLALML